jgi:hypothetical protein
MGGVLINDNAQVLDLSKKPLRGFYAAGEVTGGVHGASRLSCCAITDCLVFGRWPDCRSQCCIGLKCQFPGSGFKVSGFWVVGCGYRSMSLVDSLIGRMVK